MPDTPREERALEETAAGRREVVSLSAVLNRELWFANRGFYFVAYADVSDNRAEGVSPERVLDDEREGAIKRLSGRLVREEAVRLDDHPGREIEVATQAGLVRARIYLADRRVYHVVAGGGAEASSEDARRFFDSFKLLGVAGS